MIVVRLPAALAVLLDDGAAKHGRKVREVSLNAASWPQVVEQLRDRHPLLAKRIFKPSGEPVAGVAVVVNGEVIMRGGSILVATGDEISFIPQLAGG